MPHAPAIKPTREGTFVLTNAFPPSQIFVADLFAGAGGTSSGAARAIAASGRSMNLVAVNHWQVAVDTHQLNHPNAQHYVQDLEHADPELLVPSGHLDILLASPECRYFSRARGGKPAHDQDRMSPWIVQRWLTSIDVTRILVENVPEFIHWGPLLPSGKADKTRRGLYFQQWFQAIIGLGYQAEWRLLNAADFGDATTRIRFFLQARNDGKPITWPNPTHNKQGRADMMGQLPKWRGACDIIDWSNPGRSLLDHPKYRKRPLSVKTRRRIAKGLQRFAGPLAERYISLLDIPRVPSDPPNCAAPLSQQTHTAQPFIIANRNQNAPKPMDHPIPTATTSTGGGSCLIQAQATPFVIGQQSCSAPRQTLEPVPTVAAAGAISLIQPSIIPLTDPNDVPDGHEPLSNILSNHDHACIEHTAHEPEHPQNLAELDPRRVIEIDGTLHILDIKFRMLQNNELARAMGFQDEDTDYRFVGNITQVARQIGNAVPVNIASALVSAALA